MVPKTKKYEYRNSLHPRNVEKIYIPHDNGMEFESCILLEPSQQYRNDFLEDIIFQKQLRSELEEIERSNQITSD